MKFLVVRFLEIAAIKDISEHRAQRQWEKARISLNRKISAELEA